MKTAILLLISLLFAVPGVVTGHPTNCIPNDILTPPYDVRSGTLGPGAYADFIVHDVPLSGGLAVIETEGFVMMFIYSMNYHGCTTESSSCAASGVTTTMACPFTPMEGYPDHWIKIWCGNTVSPCTYELTVAFT